MDDLHFDFNGVEAYHVYIINLINAGKVDEALNQLNALPNEARQLTTLYQIARARHFDLVNACDLARHLVVQRAANGGNALESALDAFVALGHIRDLNLNLTYSLSHDLGRVPDVLGELDEAFKYLFAYVDDLALKPDAPLLLALVQIRSTVQDVITPVMDRLLNEYPLAVTLQDLVSLSPARLREEVAPFLEALMRLQEAIAKIKDEPFEAPTINSIIVGAPSTVQGSGWGDAVRVVQQIMAPHKRARSLEELPEDLDDVCKALGADVVALYAANADDTARQRYINLLYPPLKVLYASPLL